MPKLKQRLKSKSVYLLIAGVLAACLLLCLCAVVAGVIYDNSDKSQNTSSEPNQDVVDDTEQPQNIGEVKNDSPNCSLPVVEYKKNAFSFGVPKGWIYDIKSGTVAISQDDTNTTSVHLYTAKLETDITGEDFLQQYSQAWKQSFSELGGSFNTTTPVINSNSAEATISGSIGQNKISGKMSAEVAEGFIILKTYWAPTAELTKQEATLKEVCNCFARTKIITDEILQAEEKGILKTDTTSQFASYQGKYFRLNKPGNFTVTTETDSGIDLTRADGNAGFSYAYATGVAGAYTPRSWAERALPEFAGIRSLQLGTGRSITSPINGQTIQEFDFTGLLNGSINVQGKVTVGIYLTPYTGFGTRYSSAFWGIQVATPSAWPAARDTLQSIQDSLTITDIGNTRRNTILPPNRPIESVSASGFTSKSSYSGTLEKSAAERWDDAMRGYETVESPSTGQRYDVPQNSWSSYGPEGPGYYRSLPDNSLEKLQ